jgi:hypothetical protein
MCFATFNNVSVLYHSFAVGRSFRRLMIYATFNNVSVIYQSFAVGSVFRRLMFYDTFNIVSVIYHTSAVGMGVQESHVLCHLQYSVIYHTFAVCRGVQGSHGLCHFQYCFSHLPHMCYRQGGSEGSCLLPLSIMFQSFTAPVL